MRSNKIKPDGGFTLFEVVVVILLIGLFTTVAIVQHAATDPTLIAQAHVLQSHIRYAQMRSMDGDDSWGIAYHHSSSYYEIYTGSPTNVVDLPGESENRVRLDELGITIESTVGGTPAPQDFNLSFDSWGQPHMNIPPVMATTPITLNLIKTGQTPVPLTIIQHTGFIP